MLKRIKQWGYAPCTREEFWFAFVVWMVLMFLIGFVKTVLDVGHARDARLPRYTIEQAREYICEGGARNCTINRLGMLRIKGEKL